MADPLPAELSGIAWPSTWLDWSRLVAFVFTAPVVVFGAWLAWHRTKAAGKQAEVNAQRQITETFSRAVEQLGNEDAVPVRIGAIYALERIARTTPEEHWQVMETLTAFVRQQAPRTSSGEQADLAGIANYEASAAEGQLRADVQAALTVIGRRDTTQESEDQILDLRQVDLVGVELAGAQMAGAKLVLSDLSRADLTGADLQGTELNAAVFSYAILTDANLGGASLPNATLANARLIGASLEGTDLESCDLQEADVSYADLAKASMLKAALRGATLCGANFSEVDLEAADLSGADLTDARGLTEDQLRLACAEGDRPPKLPIELQHVKLNPVFE